MNEMKVKLVRGIPVFAFLHPLMLCAPFSRPSVSFFITTHLISPLRSFSLLLFCMKRVGATALHICLAEQHEHAWFLAPPLVAAGADLNAPWHRPLPNWAEV